ncbi:MAG: DAK2 domain-containing protein [Christensenellaceae bacterium]|jgi:DAK2 domain fusion protein YloV|nr:DAK2 domain-containing protein [Christensenellaceae bacterium]
MGEKITENKNKKTAIKTLSGANLKKIFIGGYNLLDKNKAFIDALNVFPVPDGDTGLNMSLTLKSVLKEIENVATSNIPELTTGIERGALKGARGNSGVITSQILKGMMFVLGKVGDAKITTKVFATAIKEGARVAYSAVTVPKEGTILTVIRVMGSEAEKIAKGTGDFIEFFQKVIIAGEEILAKTPEMLPVLKKAGVVDAGGRGIITVFRGFLATLEGTGEVELKFDNDTAVFRDTADEIADIEDISEIEFAYCTEFFVVNMKKTTTMASIDAFREKLVTIGDSVICVGDLIMVKVHIHTNTPNIALGYALDIGEITKIKIENMLEQNRELRASRNIEDKAQGIVVVANGEGINSLFKELGVDFIIKGGQTMNPSAQEIATAVDRVHAKTVFVFPNNKNIVLAAMNAQSLTDKTIVVIPTKSINEGISAVITFATECSVEENTQNFIAATNSVVSASVTYAVRSTKIDNLDIKEGDIIGLDDKTILAKGKTPNEVVEKLVTKLIQRNEAAAAGGAHPMRDSFSSVTLFYGEGIKESQANALANKLQSKFQNCEVTAIDGGQSVYYYLISLE